MITPRSDILIYAHDGRGLGHAGRSIAIGMALRRLYPHLKVLFVSGCRQSQELIDTAPLDWLKLPSYETKVENGKSIGITGRSMFSDEQLAVFRARELEHLVGMYRPRMVLVDHTPQGKHKELVPALTLSLDFGTRWILGVRGVVGAVPQAGSQLAEKLFRKHYKGLLWYGDSDVLGDTHVDQLRRQYSICPIKCGYVSRFAEVAGLREELSVKPAERERFAGTVSVPWLGDKSLSFLELFADALTAIPKKYGKWHLFIETGDSRKVKETLRNMFHGGCNCILEQPGPRYVEALLCSKTAVIYGGYNSLVDVLHTGLPALVVEREMQDNEQQLHLKRLLAKVGERIHVFPESEIHSEQIVSFLLDNLSKDPHPSTVNLDGAAKAAATLNHMLN